MSTVIKVENLSKQYRLGSVGLGSLSHDINRWWQTSVRGKENPYLKIGEENNREMIETGRSVYKQVAKSIGLNFDALRKWMERSVAQRSKTLFERSEFVLLSGTTNIFSKRNYSLDFFGYFLHQGKKVTTNLCPQ